LEELWEPKLCPEEVNIDEIQEYLLDQLRDTGRRHGDQGVDREERDVVQVSPDELDEEGPKMLRLNILRYKISHKCLKDLDPATLNLGHYRLLDYKIVMKQTIH